MQDHTMSSPLKRLFAWMLAHGMGRYEQAMGERKRALLAPLRGCVVEIGPGAGVNLHSFAPDVEWIGIEPNPWLHPYLRQEAARLGRSIELHSGTAEAIDLPDASADAVVSTLVLCSVSDPARVLEEVLRVLKPGGRFVFLEHVAAPCGSGLRRLQRLLRPGWRVIADGCRPDRETWRAIEQAGFRRVEIEHFRGPIPVIRPHIAGTAEK
jgi:ubiquinone/menaquinone biosynthesis C-methylase UbiE